MDPSASPEPELDPGQGTSTPVAFRAVRGAFWVMLNSYWTIGFGFVANIVLTRLLDPNAYGTFALAVFFSQLLRVQPKLGLGYAFAQHKQNTGRLVGTYIPTELATATSGLLLSCLAVPILLGLGYAPLVVQVSVILSIAAMTEGLAGMGITLCDKELLFSQTSLIQSVVLPVSYAPAFWLASHGGGVWSLVAQTMTYSALLMIGTWWIVYRRLTFLWKLEWLFDRRLAVQMASFGITVGVALLASMLLAQLDNFMIGTFVGAAALGFYDRAYRTAQWPSTLLSSLLSRTVFYTYAHLRDDITRLSKTVTMVMWLLVMLALPLAVLLFIIAPDLVALLYGERWMPSALFMRILVVYSVVRPLSDNAGALFIATGKPGLMTKFTLLQVLVLLAAGLPLTLTWGAVGTSVAVGLAFGVGLILVYRSITRAIPVKLWSILGLPALVSLLTLTGYLALSRLTGLNDMALPIRIVLKATYAVTTFFTLTFITQPRSTLERIHYVWRLARMADD